VYQLVEPASSPSPQSWFGRHSVPIGVSILSPSTHGLPAQSCQVSGLHSAQAAPLPQMHAVKRAQPLDSSGFSTEPDVRYD
jgi:hypothetical protein